MWDAWLIVSWSGEAPANEELMLVLEHAGRCCLKRVRLYLVTQLFPQSDLIINGYPGWSIKWGIMIFNIEQDIMMLSLSQLWCYFNYTCCESKPGCIKVIPWISKAWMGKNSIASISCWTPLPGWELRCARVRWNQKKRGCWGWWNEFGSLVFLWVVLGVLTLPETSIAPEIGWLEY